MMIGKLQNLEVWRIKRTTFEVRDPQNGGRKVRVRGDYDKAWATAQDILRKSKELPHGAD